MMLGCYKKRIIEATIVGLALLVALHVTCSNNPSGRSLSTSSPIVNLIQDDLPTYTGWARPNTTKVHSYHIASSTSSSVVSQQPQQLQHQQPHKVNEPWSVTIQCHAAAAADTSCAADSPQLYMRAYGPSVTTGQLTWNNATHYEFTFVPRDAGIYTVELVLTFSNVPKWNLFPLDHVDYDPGFEGYLVPGFPLQIKVVPQQQQQSVTATTTTTTESSSQGTSCGQSDLLYSHPYEKLDVNHVPARWKVLGRGLYIPPAWPTTEDTNHTYFTFTEPPSMLGLEMEYQYQNCNLRPMEDLVKQTKEVFTKLNDNKHLYKPIRVIFVGDSVMGLIRMAFERELTARLGLGKQGIRISGLTGHGALAQKWETIKKAMDDLLVQHQDEQRFILFNAGLHDVNRLCSQEHGIENKAELVGPLFNGNTGAYSCVEAYRKTYQEMITYLRSYPAELKVMQTTTAGWPKYGNFHMGWPTSTEQPASRSPEMAAVFNEIAVEVVRDFGGPTFQVMDGYHISNARPDNREVNPYKGAYGRLVHPGVEVRGAMLQTWSTAFAERLRDLHMMPVDEERQSEKTALRTS